MTLVVAQAGRASMLVETSSVAAQALNTHAWGDIRGALTRRLLDAPSVAPKTWQAQDVTQVPLMATRELQDVVLELGCPRDDDSLAMALAAHGLSYPWAEEHFQERVGGEPLNPPPSHVRWPHAKNGNAQHGGTTQFSHTYPERFWPREAGPFVSRELGRQRINLGIRFQLGDYSDLLDLLVRDPETRQAYLPIWFPEDTGAHHKERVPCSLGYHFMVRDGRMSVRYYLRSCDFVRHLVDDVYMALRLLQETCERVNHYRAVNEQGDPITPSHMVMHISSLHIFEGDVARLEEQ